MTSKEINDRMNLASVLASNDNYPDAYYELMDILERIIADDLYGQIERLKEELAGDDL